LSKFGKEDPYWNFQIVKEVESKYNVKSTFFFLNETKKLSINKVNEWKLALGRYDLHDKKIKDEIVDLNSSGWEIGLHGSYDSYNCEELLQKEKEDLEKIVGRKVYGIRQHYLNLLIPHTWNLHKKLNFHFDASFGYKDRIGYKDNKYLPFFPFNDEFMVIPLVIMDSALRISLPDISEAWERCLEIIQLAEKQGALLTINWHQRIFNEKEHPGYGKMYEKIIKVCKEREAWFTSGEEIYKQFYYMNR
jgi:peptidoglycan/xylan/chitin deacetylase (PgdA/CDA1 family)